MGVSKTCAKVVSVVYPVHIAGKARNLLVLSEPSTVRYEVIFHTFIVSVNCNGKMVSMP